MKVGRLQFLPLVLWAVFACSSDDEKIIKAPPASIEYTDNVDRILLKGSSSLSDEHPELTFAWSTTNENIVIEDSDVKNAYFMIPDSDEESSAEVKLTVTSSEGVYEETVLISVPAWTDVRAFGLGKSVVREKDNTVAYSWYLDQGNTGTHSSVNCGPTSVTMAIKWAKESFTGTPEDARGTYRSGGGWWFTSDIINYLNLKGVNNKTVALSSMGVVADEIDEGNIVILCLDMYYVQYTNSEVFHKDKFYVTGSNQWGHFIVVKGYKKVDSKTYFEVYDPYNWEEKYADETLKGQNRYYLEANLETATNLWWDNAIVISKGSSGGRHRALDTNKIVHMPGR